MKPSFPLLAVLSLSLAGPSAAASPFFDPAVPVHATPVNAGSAGVIARGLLVRTGGDGWVVFDQDLLRPALWFHAPEGKPPVSLAMMSQASWEKATQKGGVKPPVPAAPGLAMTPELPGVAGNADDLLKDPRPTYGNDPGRGGLEGTGRRFLGYHLAGDAGVLSYQCGGLVVREWYDGNSSNLSRHLSVAAGGEMLFLVAAGDFEVKGATATSPALQVSGNHPGLKLEAREGHLFARLAASKGDRRVTLNYGKDRTSSTSPTPAPPAAYAPRWKQGIDTRITEATRSGPGWALDRIALPEGNPWKRRVRPADIVFLSPEKAAVVTFEGDVWRLDLGGARVRWTRIAAGLCEPLSIEQVKGVVQVHTRNGLVRLRDLNGDGETDFYENHSSLLVQTAGLRGYPLDMEVDAEGNTWCSTGGIVTDDKTLTNRPAPGPHTGAILKISADGTKIDVIGKHAREPFFGRDPVTGHLAMSEQQGHWQPSSASYPVPEGASFGFGYADDSKITPPAVWIPHDQDTSSSSPMWLRGTAFKGWEGGLLQLSYGTGRLFLVRHGEGWPAREGAVIPLGIETGIPVLHARTHPVDGSIWLAGFRIYDSRAPELEALARLRPTGEPLAAPVDARVVKEGVVISFDAPLDPASVTPDAVQAKEWQYRRSGGYGSPRFKRDGTQGVDPVPTGGTFLSKDGKSAFIHIPELKPTMQLEVSHRFHLKGGKDDARSVFFTVAAPSPAVWDALGFDTPRLDAAAASVHGGAAANATPTVELGKDLSTRYGCIACHSLDGTKEGHSGPSWKGLYGSERRLTQGPPRKADDAYLIESMVDPGKAIVEGYALGMGSYAGVLSDAEMQSIVLFIKSLE
ncbi:cytochrome c [Luteolibacter flavescens]|uniref:Cytochrome c n=1 Tax=Luteolibacter flavescens TaxID=1859460 RepID=A0ABT3FN90_9BACT|nr:cytochrome c [Luteolibacter flavescens]MCW1884721.1 cytochrome c [Luteolibacter flavescens]